VGTTKNKEARIFYLDEELKEVFREEFPERSVAHGYGR